MTMARRYLRAMPELLLWGTAACIWWMSVPRLLGLDLPYPIASLGAALLVPLLALREAAFVLTDRLVEQGREIGLTLDTSAFVLGTAVAILSPAPVFAHVFGVPLLSSLGLVLVSDLGVAVLAVLGMCLSVRSPDAAGHGAGHG